MIKMEQLKKYKRNLDEELNRTYKDPICRDCKEELVFKTTIHTLDITMTEERWVRIWFCPKCGQRYQKNVNGDYVKGIGKEEIEK